MVAKVDSLSPIDRHTFQVGLITKCWAVIETALDLAASLSLAGFDGKKIEKQLPRNLKRKLQFLRKSLKSSPLAAPFYADADRLLESTMEAAVFRHKCVHGIVYQDGNGFPGELHMILRGSETLNIESSRIEEIDLVNAIQEAFFLIHATAIFHLCMRIKLEADLGDDASKSLESISRSLKDLSLRPPSTKRAKRVCKAGQELANLALSAKL